MFLTAGFLLYAKWQLDEIRDSSKDTKAIAEASKQQSDNTKTLAKSAQEQATAAIDQVRELKGVVKATEASVNAAKESIRVAQENIRLDQRAWVGLGGAIHRNVTAGSQGTFGFTIINSGKTPALKVKTFAAARYLRKGVKFSPLDPSELPGQESTSVLHPTSRVEATTTFPGNRAFTEAEIAAFKQGDIIMYFFGKITYWDFFKNPRYTHICLYMGQDLATAKGCDTYNEAN